MNTEQNNTMYRVYLLECSDGTFYCGITTDIERRINEHNAGTASKYTRGRTPVKLLGSIPFRNRSEATKFEMSIKKKSREKKLKLIVNKEEDFN